MPGPALQSYPWEPAISMVDFTPLQMEQAALSHQVDAYTAGLYGIPGSGYPLPPPGGAQPVSAQPAAPSVVYQTRVGSPPRPPLQPSVSSPYVSVVDWGSYSAPLEPTSLVAQTCGTTRHASRVVQRPSMVPVQQWDMDTAQATQAALDESVRVGSASAASGGIRGTERPLPASAPPPMRVTPGVPARTFPRMVEVRSNSRGGTLTVPGGALHSLYGG